MLSVPAAIACARVGDLANSRRHLEIARQSAPLWQDTSWEGAIAEAEAALAAASGDLATAQARLRFATEQFHRTGQPLDAQRCQRAMAYS
jgi:hypothetical protein